MTCEVDFIDEWGFPTANTLYGNFPLLCPQWLVWAEPRNPQRLQFPCQLPVFHGPFAFQAAFAHTMQGDCRGRAPSWNWWFFHICFFVVSSVWRVIWDLKFQIFVHEQTSNEMLCIILRNLGGSFLWSWIFHGRWWSIWSSHRCLKLVHG